MSFMFYLLPVFVVYFYVSRNEASESEKRKLLESQYPSTIQRAKYAEANVSAVLQSIKQVRIVVSQCRLTVLCFSSLSNA